MSWLILFLAGLLEVAWAVGLKLHAGRFTLILVTVVAAVASIVLLTIAMKQIPLGTAYAVWTGIGIIGTFAIGAVLLGESISPEKIIWTTLIIAGIIGLKLSS